MAIFVYYGKVTSFNKLHDKLGANFLRNSLEHVFHTAIQSCSYFLNLFVEVWQQDSCDYLIFYILLVSKIGF